LPAALAGPIVVVALLYLAAKPFRTYLLALDLRLVLSIQLWRVIGIGFLFALAFGQLPAGFAVPAGVGDLPTRLSALPVLPAHATLPAVRLSAFTAPALADSLVATVTGRYLAPPALVAWPVAISPTIMVPFFAILHLIAVLQSRHDWEGRVHHFAIPPQAEPP